MDYKRKLIKNIVNLPGWRTNRKIVVFESDDWGSVRMPSRKVYDLLLLKGIAVDKNYFLKNDCLESEIDLISLFEVLSKYKDKSNSHPVITANSVVANPDFDKIILNGVISYDYELITETYKRYPNHLRVMDLWHREGIDGRLLIPQFHGREHINVKKWMLAISQGDEVERLAFNNNVLLGIGVSSPTRGKYQYMAAFEYDSDHERADIECIVEDGLKHFHTLFGFKSKSFVPSCSIQGEHLNEVLARGGVKYNQSGQHFLPLGNGRIKEVNYFWGHRNQQNQIYWRRNCTFEPSKNQDYDWVNSCLSEMKIAFRWGKPAVINTHRVNYMGGIFEENRTQSLKKLDLLLQAMLKKWPDIEFVSSDELGDIISGANRE